MWLERLGHTSRHHGYEVLVAVVVITTGVWEEFIVEATEADAELLQTNHTIFLFGLIQLLKFAPHLFVSLEVIGDADRAGPGTNITEEKAVKDAKMQLNDALNAS